MNERLKSMEKIRVFEMFAGVGGFRIALEKTGRFQTTISNQWEPGGPRKQFAAEIYQKNFGSEGFYNEDVHNLLNKFEHGRIEKPEIDMIVGGFPCQDYSVAKPLSLSQGIEGKKGVLWWEVHKAIGMFKPNHVLLENVDRLLTSPSKQRGRDFAIILSCLMSEGYHVEWRVINASEYGFPQSRKRVFIYATKTGARGVLSRAFPGDSITEETTIQIPESLYEITQIFSGSFLNSGRAYEGKAETWKTKPAYEGSPGVLADALVDDAPEDYVIDESDFERWEYVKGAKSIERTKPDGFKYLYKEGAMLFPDSLERPARTILTSEGGKSALRTKHAVRDRGVIRRLTPVELERLQGFPDGWTEGITPNQRAFCMGNALVVGCIEKIAEQIA